MYQFPRLSTYNEFCRIFLGTNLPNFPHLMVLAVFFHVMGNQWENTCISHLLKYTIRWESDGKKAPILWEKYDYWFPRLSPYHAICCIFPYCGKFMGKPKDFPNDGIGYFFLWSKHFKVKGFLNFWLEAEIHAVPKIWEKWISMVQAKYWNTQTFKIYGFLKYFGWSRPPYNYQNMGNMNSYDTWKVWEKTNIPKLWFSQIFWVKQKSIQFPKYGKSESP